MSNRKCKCMPNSTRWCWWYLSWNYIHAWFSISFKQINFIRANQMVMREEGYLASQHQVEVSSQRKKRKILQNACLKAGFQPHEHVSRANLYYWKPNHGVTWTPTQLKIMESYILRFKSGSFQLFISEAWNPRITTGLWQKLGRNTLSRQLVTRSCSIVDFGTSDDCGHQAWRDHLALWRYTYLGQANPVEQQEKLENSNGGWKSPEHRSSFNHLGKVRSARPVGIWSVSHMLEVAGTVRRHAGSKVGGDGAVEFPISARWMGVDWEAELRWPVRGGDETSYVELPIGVFLKKPSRDLVGTQSGPNWAPIFEFLAPRLDLSGSSQNHPKTRKNTAKMLFFMNLAASRHWCPTGSRLRGGAYCGGWESLNFLRATSRSSWTLERSLGPSHRCSVLNWEVEGGTSGWTFGVGGSGWTGTSGEDACGCGGLIDWCGSMK